MVEQIDGTKKVNFISEEVEKTLFPKFVAKVSNNPRTKAEYFGYIRVLCNNVLYKDFLDITEKDAKRAFSTFRRKMREEKLSIRTIKVRLSCYNSFSKFIEEEYPEYGFVNPFEEIEKPFLTDEVSSKNIPSLEEIDKILTTVKKNRMYYLIIAMTMRTGIAPSKLLNLTNSSVFTEEDRVCIYVPDKMEKKTVTMTLPDDIGKLLVEYMELIEEQDFEGHLFYNKYGNALTLKNLDTTIKRIIKKAGIENDYTIKDLRSRAILDMLHAGADEKDVANYVGIQGIRLRQFSNAKGIVRGCPADLVNFQLRV